MRTGKPSSYSQQWKVLKRIGLDTTGKVNFRSHRRIILSGEREDDHNIKKEEKEVVPIRKDQLLVLFLFGQRVAMGSNRSGFKDLWP